MYDKRKFVNNLSGYEYRCNVKTESKVLHICHNIQKLIYKVLKLSSLNVKTSIKVIYKKMLKLIYRIINNLNSKLLYYTKQNISLLTFRIN